MKEDIKNIRIWKRIAQIAGVFAFIISMLLIVNYAQYKRIDPIETELINSLVERLNENPEDNKLREQIRTVDLLARKAYFTSQWQIRTGGYLLLLSIAVLVIAMQIIKSKSLLEVIVTDKEDSFFEQKNARKWISISGIIMVATALTFAFLTHNELSEEFSSAGLTGTDNNISVINEQTKSEKIILDEVIVEEHEVVELQEPVESESKSEKVKVENVKSKAKPAQTETKEVIEEKVAPKVEKTLAEFPSEEEIFNNHPSFRGPGGNGISYRKNIPVNWDGQSGQNIIWKLEIPLHGYNSPIIWEDKIFLSGANSAQREVYCIDRNTGKILWTGEVKNIPGSPATSPKVTDDTGQAAPSLTTDGRRVYAIFANGDVIAFDMDGNQLWARNLGSAGNHYGHSSSLMLYQNVLIVQYDIKKSPRILGLAVATGETIWETPRKVKVSWASPIVVNTGEKTEVFLVAEPIVSSYDPITGIENWNVDCIFGEVGPSAAYAEGVVFAVNEYAILVAIKIGETPEILWESDEYLSDVPSPVATSELLFMATSYGVVVCYNAKTGEIYWESEYDNGFYSSPMMVDDKIYLIDMQGIMHIFKVDKEFVLVGESELGETCMTSPAFTDGKIYIRGNKHLFCIGNN